MSCPSRLFMCCCVIFAVLARASPSTASDPPTRHAFRVVSASGVASLIVPIVHVVDPGFLLTSTTAIEGHPRVFLEVDPRDRGLADLATQPISGTWTRDLDEQSIRQLGDRLRCGGHRRDIDSYHPLVLILASLSGCTTQEMGVGERSPSRKLAVDRIIAASLLARGRRVDVLETYGDLAVQIERIDRADVLTLISSVEGDGAPIFSRLQAIASTYDAEKQSGLLQDMRSLAPEMFEVMWLHLLKERNSRWGNVLDPVLQAEPSLVFVGVLHTIGVDGLPALLSRRGYRVEVIDIAADPAEVWLAALLKGMQRPNR